MSAGFFVCFWVGFGGFCCLVGYFFLVWFGFSGLLGFLLLLRGFFGRGVFLSGNKKEWCLKAF